MVNVHIQSDGSGRRRDGRLNVLLTENRPHAPEHWTSQLPRLLEPQGVVSYLARSTPEAIELASQRPIHAAVIDLATPGIAPGTTPEAVPSSAPGATPAGTAGSAADGVDQAVGSSPNGSAGRRSHAAMGRGKAPATTPGGVAGGIWLTELFKRFPDRPSVVIINSPTYTDKQLERLLHEALRLGAFSVMNKPVQLEQLLVVFQRLLDRRYQGVWPAPRPDSPGTDGTGAPQ